MKREKLKVRRERLKPRIEAEEPPLKRVKLKMRREKLVSRERISLLEIARITDLYPSTVDLWRRDIAGYWKALHPCPADPPITASYADHVRVQFFLDELLIWLEPAQRRQWFEKLLYESRNDPMFYIKREKEMSARKKYKRGKMLRMPDAPSYPDFPIDTIH